MGIYHNMGVVGLFRQEKRYDIIANNLSNLQTAGFKKDVPVFEKVFTEALNSSRAENPVSSITVFQQGDLQSTRNDLDLAIEGEGFFKVRDSGRGALHPQRQPAFESGRGAPRFQRAPGRWEEGAKSPCRGGHISIDKDGTIWTDGNSQAKIDLVTFKDLKALKKAGSNLYRNDSEQEEIEAAESRIHQGSLEQSNVNAMEEMVRIIDAMRSFEACHKVVQVEDELNGRAVNDLARV